jgi:hypothetical protein
LSLRHDSMLGHQKAARFRAGFMDRTTKQRMLQRAAVLVGREMLALRLNVPATVLDVWLRGLATMPDRKLLPLADLIDTLGDPESE